MNEREGEEMAMERQRLGGGGKGRRGHGGERYNIYLGGQMWRAYFETGCRALKRTN